MPKFEMLVGLPGSGKSTYAENTKKQDNNTIWLSSDKLRKAMYGDVADQTRNDLIFQTMERWTVEMLKDGKDVIYDATNVSRKRRMEIVRTVKKIESVTSVCRVMLCHVSDLYRINEERDKPVPPHVIHRMLCMWDTPWYYEGWDEIIFDDTNLTEYIEECWDRQKLNGFDQNNSHHSKTLGGHLGKTINYLIMLEDHGDIPYDRFARTCFAAMSHDIGKYYTKTFSKPNDEEAHYYGHANYGAYLFLVRECSDNFARRVGLQNVGDWLAYQSVLVNWHMKPFEWDKSVRVADKDRKLIGDQMFGDLLAIHVADTEAR